jgi:hypothetical protein
MNTILNSLVIPLNSQHHNWKNTYYKICLKQTWERTTYRFRNCFLLCLAIEVSVEKDFQKLSISCEVAFPVRKIFGILVKCKQILKRLFQDAFLQKISPRSRVKYEHIVRLPVYDDFLYPVNTIFCSKTNSILYWTYWALPTNLMTVFIKILITVRRLKQTWEWTSQWLWISHLFHSRTFNSREDFKRLSFFNRFLLPVSQTWRSGTL